MLRAPAAILFDPAPTPHARGPSAPRHRERESTPVPLQDCGDSRVRRRHCEGIRAAWRGEPDCHEIVGETPSQSAREVKSNREHKDLFSAHMRFPLSPELCDCTDKPPGKYHSRRYDFPPADG